MREQAEFSIRYHSNRVSKELLGLVRALVMYMPPSNSEFPAIPCSRVTKQMHNSVCVHMYETSEKRYGEEKW